MKRPKVEVLSLTDGPHTLASLLAAVQAKGVTDLSCVRVAFDTDVICTCGPDEPYCYCTRERHTDVRLEWVIPGQ